MSFDADWLYLGVLAITALCKTFDVKGKGTMAFPGGAEDFKGWPRGLRRKIILDRTGIAPRWEGAWLLGEGGFGVAALWLEFDYRQRVADVCLYHAHRGQH